jgi:hypothetical protein
MALIGQRHPAPEWAVFGEIDSATGFRRHRRLDAFAVNTWPSKGFHRIAFEIKTHRGDWLRELANPAKRKFAEEVAHECYFVVERDIVDPDFAEIPEGWGCLVRTKAGDKLRRTVVPTQRNPEPMPEKFVAMLLRRGLEMYHEERRRTIVFEGKELTPLELEERVNGLLDMRRQSMESRERRAEEIVKEYTEKERKLEAPFRALALAAGHSGWNMPEITADAVNEWIALVKKGISVRTIDALRHANNRLADVIRDLEEDRELARRNGCEETAAKSTEAISSSVP